MFMMSTIVARTGRHRQRYDENNLRLVSGCIPYRLINDEIECMDLKDRIQVLMLSSPNRDDFVFPKGGWENDETVEDAACREAIEEAGVRGILNETPLGIWEFRSKSKQEACCLEGGCKGYMFALKVTEELDAWPEKDNRERRWVCIEEAFELCRYEWMRNALRSFLSMLSENDNRKHDTSIDVRDEEEEEEELVVLEEDLAGKKHPVPVGVENDHHQECHEMISSNCHPKPANDSIMSASFGIMLPAGIFL